MEDLLNNDELLVYSIGGLWLSIALLIAYINTKKEFGYLKISKFIGLFFKYTIGVVLILIDVFLGDGKNTGGSGSSSSGGGTNRIITKVQCRNGFANVTYSTGKNKALMSFTVAAKEVVGWNGQSVTVKVLVNSKYIVNTYDVYGKLTDTYFE